MAIETQAAPSTATIEVPAAGTAAYTEWRKTGNLPAPTKAESAPAKESQDLSATESGDDAETVESASASEAGKESEEQPVRRGRSNAEQRIKELLAENKRLKAEKTAAPNKTEKGEAESSPAKQPAKLEAPKKPDIKEFTVAKYGTAEKAYEAFDAAKDEYHEKNAEYKAEMAVQKDRQARYFEAEAEKLNSQIAEGAKRYGQEKMGEVLEPVAAEIMGDTKIPDGVKSIIGESPVLVDLLYVFASNRAQFDAWLKIARLNPAKAIREAVKLEQLVAEELASKKTAAENASNITPSETAETDIEEGEIASGEDDDSQPERDPQTGKFLKASAPPNKITRAPGPTHEVNATASAAADEATAALERGDFGRYRELKNAQDLKRGRKA